VIDIPVQYANALKPSVPYPEELPLPLPVSLTPAECNPLVTLINPAYTSFSTLELLRKEFIENSHIVLANCTFGRSPFLIAISGLTWPSYKVLRQDIADELKNLIVAADKADRLSRDERTEPDGDAKGVLYCVPPHSAGEKENWKLVGPPHIQRYLTLVPPPSIGNGNKGKSSAPQDRLDSLLASIAEMFASPEFRRLLAALTSLAPLSHSIEARRFRPGLDYTLARGEMDEIAKLDVGLTLTPEDEEEERGSEEEEFEDDGDSDDGDEGSWISGEVGGWDIWVAHEADSDEATYGGGAKASVKSNGDGDGKEGEKVEGEGSGDGDEEEEEDDDDDGPLLSLPPTFNQLHLVLRDPGVLRFVKYVSSRASASRWDVAGEWGVGQVEEEDEEEDKKADEKAS
jgi:hypothetical protein